MVTWLATAKGPEAKNRLPSSILSWQRNGFGCLMIIIRIKLCVTTYPGATIDMYFQTDDVSSYHFYVLQGCQQINQGSSDGSNLLPLDMVAGLAHCRELNPDIKFLYFTFHIEVEGFSVPPPKLMRLRHDKLRNKKARSRY